MSRRFTIVTLALTAIVAFLVGAIVAGGLESLVGDGRVRRNQPRPQPATRPAIARGARPGQFRGRGRADQSGGGEHRRDRRRGSSDDRRRRPMAPICSIARTDSRRRRAPRRGAGSGFIIDAGRQHPDQRSRHRTGGADHREAVGRPQPARAGHRRRSGHRHRADQGRWPARVCRSRRSATRRRCGWGVGLRDRQSARLRAHGDRRRRQLPRPEAVRREPRQLHPDRRRDQFRQQRRAADQRRAARSSASTRRSARAPATSVSPCRSTAPRRSCRSCARAAASRADTSASRCARSTAICSDALKLPVNHGAIDAGRHARVARRSRRPAALRRDPVARRAGRHQRRRADPGRLRRARPAARSIFKCCATAGSLGRR